MAKPSFFNALAAGNRLLAALPPAAYQRLEPHLVRVPLALKQVVYEARDPVDYGYFPTRGLISAVTVMEDGAAIEVGHIGSEGMAGLPAVIEAKSSVNRLFVQVEGEALRIEAHRIVDEFRLNGPLTNILQRYQSFYISQVSQTAACNGIHPLGKRCCRWLLMTHDRIEGDVLPLTHEFLSIMLGVRRAGVTEVLQELQGNGYIRTGRGEITVSDREGLEGAACECYRHINAEYERLFP